MIVCGFGVLDTAVTRLKKPCFFLDVIGALGGDGVGDVLFQSGDLSGHVVGLQDREQGHGAQVGHQGGNGRYRQPIRKQHHRHVLEVWGEQITASNANFYASRDPFEDMRSVGSRTTPVGFYNGQTYAGFVTADSASPYGLYDMAGNVWQWTGDVYEGMHYRFLRGGSKDVYDMDLRLWVRNNATPTYVSPGVGFRCAR